MAQTAFYSGTKAEGLYLGSHNGNAPSYHWFLTKTEQGEEVMSSNAFEKHAGLWPALVDVSKGSALGVLVLGKGMFPTNHARSSPCEPECVSTTMVPSQGASHTASVWPLQDAPTAWLQPLAARLVRPVTPCVCCRVLPQAQPSAQHCGGWQAPQGHHAGQWHCHTLVTWPDMQKDKQQNAVPLFVAWLICRRSSSKMQGCSSAVLQDPMPELEDHSTGPPLRWCGPAAQQDCPCWPQVPHLSSPTKLLAAHLHPAGAGTPLGRGQTQGQAKEGAPAGDCEGRRYRGPGRAPEPAECP